MKKEEFYIGQRVKQKDPDEGYMTYGHVREIREKSIIIDWNDPEYGPMLGVEHFEDEFPTIRNGIPE